MGRRGASSCLLAGGTASALSFPPYCPLYTCKRRYLIRRCSDRDLPAPGEAFLGPAFGWSSQLPPLVSVCCPLLLAPHGYSGELGLLAGLFRRCKNDRFKKEMENAAGNGLCLSLELANTSRAWIACATLFIKHLEAKNMT